MVCKVSYFAGVVTQQAAKRTRMHGSISLERVVRVAVPSTRSAESVQAVANGRDPMQVVASGREMRQVVANGTIGVLHTIVDQSPKHVQRIPQALNVMTSSVWRTSAEKEYSGLPH